MHWSVVKQLLLWADLVKNMAVSTFPSLCQMPGGVFSSLPCENLVALQEEELTEGLQISHPVF